MTAAEQLPLLDVEAPWPCLFVAPCECSAFDADACVCGPFPAELEDHDDDR